MARLLSRDFDAWSEAASRVGHCANPIRLRRPLRRPSTRRPVRWSRSYSSARRAARGDLHVRCGNRRAAECPSCSRLYAADTFHLIRAGVAGGKGVPEAVAENPLVFATLTAPSFGPVHGTRDDGGRCRPTPRRAGRAARTAGRRPAMTAHDRGRPARSGSRCAADCYDYASHVVWQWWAPELWRRFTIALRRAARPAPRRPGHPAGRGGDRAVRQGRRVPAARRWSTSTP